MAVLLISDLHLNPCQPELAQAFTQFLTSVAQDAQTLYILGDLFDAWIGDDEDLPFVNNIREQLFSYANSGRQLFIQRGNRDFLMGEQFARATNSHLLADETLVTLARQRVLLMHGDSLCTGDAEYMAFRSMVRNPTWQAQVLALPLVARRQMAQDLRAKSQSLNAVKAEDIMDVTPAEVLRVMRQHQVLTLIHGHTHRPAQHEFDLDGAPAKRIVLGDWGAQGCWYVKAEQVIELLKFECK